jgi:hypothetical protein
MQSGTIGEKQCLKHAEYLNKRNFYDTYELVNLKRYMMLGGSPKEFIDKFCRNQHVYHMSYLKKGQLVTNENAVKEKNDKMFAFIKEYGLKKLEDKKITSNNQEYFSVDTKVPKPEITKFETTEPQQKLSQRELDVLKPDYIKKVDDEQELNDFEAEILR